MNKILLPAIRTIMLAACFSLALVSCKAEQSTNDQKGPPPSSENQTLFPAWNVITVGVGDLDTALALWVDDFGLTVAKAKDGPDTDLARLWGLEPGDIARQALVQTNDSAYGMIHFVQFNQPDAPVRDGAQNFDLTPKNLDIYVKDLPEKYAALKAKGARFRADKVSELSAPDGTQFREIHMFGHDVINIVLLERVGAVRNYTPKDYAGIGPFVFIVPDLKRETDFFQDVLQVGLLSRNSFSGPEIEKAVGLPKGTRLDIDILGEKGFDLGELEIIEYAGVASNNLYPKARPKALGVLHIAYVVPSAKGLKQRLLAQDVTPTDHGSLSTLVGDGAVFSFQSPAGLRVEVYETGQ